MIVLEEFLSKLFSVGAEDIPPVWIYDGQDAINPDDKEESLLCVFKSCYIPSLILNEKVLRSQVAEIYWTYEHPVITHWMHLPEPPAKEDQK